MVLANNGNTGGFKDPRLVGVEEPIAVSVSGDESGGEIIGKISGSAVVIGNRHSGQRHITGVSDLVGPGDRGTGGHKHTGRSGVVYRIGQLGYCDGRITDDIAGRIFIPEHSTRPRVAVFINGDRSDAGSGGVVGVAGFGSGPGSSEDPDFTHVKHAV